MVSFPVSYCHQPVFGNYFYQFCVNQQPLRKIHETFRFNFSRLIYGFHFGGAGVVFTPYFLLCIEISISDCDLNFSFLIGFCFSSFSSFRLNC